MRYGRFLPGQHEPEDTWPDWKIAHFANKVNRGDLYGRGILHSNLRSWVQIEAMEGGMMTRRLERASQRYKHVVDTSGLDFEHAMQRLRQYRTENKKIRTVDGDRNFHHQRIAAPPDEDVIVGRAGKDGVADVAPMEGDAHLAEIADFLHFWNKWLSGLGPPKHQLGYEQDTMRSVGTELHIVFARKSRRMCINFIRGLNHLYWIELLLAGVDPRKVPYVIIPPPMGTRAM